MPLFLGLDIGTSGAKAIVCDGDGQIVAMALAEYPISSKGYFAACWCKKPERTHLPQRHAASGSPKIRRYLRS